MGLLMERDPPSWHPAAAATKALCVEAVKHCKSQGVDISKIAQAFTLAEERISTTLVSTTNVVRLRKNIDAASRSAALDEVEAAALAHVRERIFQPAGDQSWEGVELATYWATVGARLMTERLYQPAANPVATRSTNPPAPAPRSSMPSSAS